MLAATEQFYRIWLCVCLSEICPAANGYNKFEAEPNKEAILQKRVKETETMVSGAIILAAGGGTRFHADQHKLLMDLGGVPMVTYAVKSAIQVGFAPVIVVIGAQGTKMKKALELFPVQLVENPEWSKGQSTSLKAGLMHLPANVDTACLMMADQPFVRLETLRALVHEQELFPQSIIVPVYRGQRGNPTMFPRVTFSALLSQETGDYGGRKVMAQFGAHEMPCEDPNIIRDIDTFADFDRLQSEKQNQSKKKLGNE